MPTSQQIELPGTESLIRRAPDPLEILQAAIEKNLSPDTLKQLMELQERWEANEARKQFENAMTNFKAETFVIPKDKENKQYNSWYTSLEKMVEVVTPFLAKHKLFATWSIDQTAGIRVSCTLEGFGHSKKCSVIFPPDASGKKNSLQEIKSAITYGKISTFEAVCGLASEAGNLSDDGNAAGKKSMTADEVDRLQEWVDSITGSASFEELEHHFREAYKANTNQTARDAIIYAKNKRKAELRGGK